MASTVKTQYGSTGGTLTISVDSLGNNGAWQSTPVSNASDLFLDVLVQPTLRSGTAGVTTTGYAALYAFGAVDGGTVYSNGAGTANGTITLTVPPNARPIGMVNMVANNVLYSGHPMSVAAAFGGVLPQSWGVIVENKTGAAFGGSTNVLYYQGIYTQVV